MSPSTEKGQLPVLRTLLQTSAASNHSSFPSTVASRERCRKFCLYLCSPLLLTCEPTHIIPCRAHDLHSQRNDRITMLCFNTGPAAVSLAEGHSGKLCWHPPPWPAQTSRATTSRLPCPSFRILWSPWAPRPSSDTKGWLCIARRDQESRGWAALSSTCPPCAHAVSITKISTSQNQRDDALQRAQQCYPGQRIPQAELAHWTFFTCLQNGDVTSEPSWEVLRDNEVPFAFLSTFQENSY